MFALFCAQKPVQQLFNQEPILFFPLGPVLISTEQHQASMYCTALTDRETNIQMHILWSTKGKQFKYIIIKFQNSTTTKNI